MFRAACGSIAVAGCRSLMIRHQHPLGFTLTKCPLFPTLAITSDVRAFLAGRFVFDTFERIERREFASVALGGAGFK